MKYGPGYRISGNICTLDNDRAKKKQRVLDKLIEFFDKFLSITGKQLCKFRGRVSSLSFYVNLYI